jgi:hypothetical protein
MHRLSKVKSIVLFCYIQSSPDDLSQMWLLLLTLTLTLPLPLPLT